MHTATCLRSRARCAALLLVLVVVAAPGRLAAGEPPKKDVQLWTPTVFQVGLSGRWSLQAETQVKVVDDVREVQNSLLRPALVYKAGRNTTLTLGYAWIPIFYPARVNEHRAWQQIVTTVQAGRWTLAPRVRFEQRFLPVVDRTSLRLRGQFKAMLPLTGDGEWQLAVSDEVFFHLNAIEPLPQRGFAGNRAQIGVTRRLSRHLSVEPGYLLQYVNRPGRYRDEIDHVVMLTTVVRFP